MERVRGAKLKTVSDISQYLAYKEVSCRFYKDRILEHHRGQALQVAWTGVHVHRAGLGQLCLPPSWCSAPAFSSCTNADVESSEQSQEHQVSCAQPRLLWPLLGLLLQLLMLV